MPLPNSGAISLYDVRTELGMASNAQIGLTDTNVRTLAQVPSGTIKLPEDFYGKSNFPPYGTFLSSYCSGYNLYYRYANGSGGYYDTLQQSNSPSCGWPPAATYQLSVDSNPVNEGNGVTITVTTTNFNNGTGNGDLYWRIVHNTTSNADFSGTGSGVSYVSNNYTTLAYYTTADQVTEGTENYYVEVSLTPGGATVANTSTLSINDTSQTPTVSWNISPSGSPSMQEGDVFDATVTVSDGGNYSAYYRVGSITAVTFSNIAPGSYNQFNIVNGVGTFQIGTSFDSSPDQNTKNFLLLIYDSSFNQKIGLFVTVTETQEIISGPTTATINVPFNINITNGVPNTTFTWVQQWSGATFGPVALDSSGSYTFSNVTFVPANPRPFTYTYVFTFAGSGNQKSYSINLL
jgi:hypothetical protein